MLRVKYRQPNNWVIIKLKNVLLSKPKVNLQLRKIRNSLKSKNHHKPHQQPYPQVLKSANNCKKSLIGSSVQ